MTIRIVEAIGDEKNASKIENYLIGLADLGWIEDLYVKGPGGEVTRLVHGLDPQTFPTLDKALEGRPIAGVEITTIAVLPTAEMGEYTSARRIVGLGADGRQSEVGSSLVLCPTSEAGESPDGWWASIPAIDNLGEVWDRRVILSPEDRTRPDEFAQRVGPEDIHASAAAAAAVLSGAVDPAITVSSLPPSNADEYRVVRIFARSADMDGVVRQLVSNVLDQGFPVYEGQALSVVAENPQRQMIDTRTKFVNDHKLRHRPSSLEPDQQEIGLGAALRMLFQFIAGGLRRLPQKLINRARADAISRLERAVTTFVLGKNSGESSLALRFGGPNQPRPTSPEDLDSNLGDLRSALVAAADSATLDSWLPELDPEPEAEVWSGLVSLSLKLLDGGDDRRSPIIDEDAFAVSEPLIAQAQSSVLAASTFMQGDEGEALTSVAFGGEIPLAFATSDPWRLETLITMLEAQAETVDSAETELDESADDSTESEDAESDEPTEPEAERDDADSTPTEADVLSALARLRFARRQAEQSFVYGIGSVILESLDRARRGLADKFEMITDEEDQATWTDKPERKVRFKIKMIAFLLIVAIGATVAGGVIGLITAMALGLIIVGILAVSTLGIIWAAIRYQRDVFRREHLIRRRKKLFDAIKDDWLAVHRFNALYRQFRQWSAIIASDVHRPVGRPGEIIVFGAQQTRPRWLLTARSMGVEPGEAERIRRATFHRGWRGEAYQATMNELLTNFAHQNGLNDIPDPALDVRDRYGSRQFLVENFVRSDRAATTKRKILEEMVRASLDQSSTDFTDSGQITEVVGRYGTEFDSLTEFFALEERDNFAAFVLGGDSPLARSDYGNLRDLASSVLSDPMAMGGWESEDGSVVQTVQSARRWPWQCSVRLDASFRLQFEHREEVVINLTAPEHNQKPAKQSQSAESGSDSDDRDEEVKW